jgi:hypothetical protein
MCANISEGLLGAGFFAAVDVRNGVPSREKLSGEDQVPTDDEVLGLDLYKVAVLVSVGIAILSLCL